MVTISSERSFQRGEIGISLCGQQCLMLELPRHALVAIRTGGGGGNTLLNRDGASPRYISGTR